MGNIVTGIFNSIKFFVENPIWSVIIVLGILLMPLEVFDLILFVIVNIVVIILNLIIFILFTLFNVIVWAVNLLITVIWNFLSSWGAGAGTPPSMPFLVFTPQPYITVNLFSPDKNILMIILELLGESLPFW